MTDLATDFIFMNPVCFGIRGLGFIDSFVTIQAFRTVFHLISVGIVLAVSVHLIGLVTLAAFKVFLSVNIGRKSLVFAKILPFDPASMARGADRTDGWSFLKEMPVEEAASSCIRTADMALPATAVAGGAMEFSGRIHLFVNRLFRSGSHVNHFLEWRKACMEALLVVFGNVIMACSTTF
jgi:hypothetical protein